MTSERLDGIAREMGDGNIEVPTDPVHARTGMPETAIQGPLLEVQTEPVKLIKTKPIWAARNPQNPL